MRKKNMHHKHMQLILCCFALCLSFLLTFSTYLLSFFLFVFQKVQIYLQSSSPGS